MLLSGTSSVLCSNSLYAKCKPFIVKRFPTKGSETQLFRAKTGGKSMYVSL